MSTNNNVYRVTYILRHTNGKDVTPPSQVLVLAAASDEATIKAALTSNGITKANSNVELQSVTNVLMGAFA